MTKLHDKIKKESWDNLIILDACRFDYFSELSESFPNIHGDLEKVISEDSRSINFLDKTFRESDAVAYSGWYKINRKQESADYLDQGINFVPIKEFQDVRPCFKSAYDPELDAVWPGPLTDKFIEGLESGESRVFWYAQPRGPFLGDLKLAFRTAEHSGKIYGYARQNSPGEEFLNLWRKAYRYNLIKVLYHVARLISRLDGRTIITSNHGESMGEAGRYGHEQNNNSEEVREVPFLKLDQDPVDLDKMEDEDFIVTCFESVFGRRPGEEALNNYLNHLSRESFERENLLSVLLTSQEYRDKNNVVLD